MFHDAVRASTRTAEPPGFDSGVLGVIADERQKAPESPAEPQYLLADRCDACSDGRSFRAATLASIR
jgi:hypothetical protein